MEFELWCWLKDHADMGFKPLRIPGVKTPASENYGVFKFRDYEVIVVKCESRYLFWSKEKINIDHLLKVAGVDESQVKFVEEKINLLS